MLTRNLADDYSHGLARTFREYENNLICNEQAIKTGIYPSCERGVWNVSGLICTRSGPSLDGFPPWNSASMRLRVTALCLSLGLTACEGQLDPPPVGAAESAAPSQADIAAGVASVAAQAKLAAPLETTALRPTHPIEPGDWVVCVRSTSPERPPPYAVFFAPKFKDFRSAVAIDECSKHPYAPFP